MSGTCSTYRGDGFDEESEGNNHVETLGIDGRMWTGFYLSQVRTKGGLFCERGNEPWSSIKFREFLD